jgi:hypothetical protein
VVNSTASTPTDLLARRVRWAGFAGAVWVVFQILMLAATRGSEGWEWRGLAINVLPTLVLAVGVLRGSLVTALAFGVYGAIRLAMALRVLVMLALGTVAASHDGLVWESILVAAFASVWILGGFAALRLRRPRTSHAPG